MTVTRLTFGELTKISFISTSINARRARLNRARMQPTSSSESTPAGSEALCLSSVRERTLRPSTSTVMYGNVFHTVSSIRLIFTSALRFSLARRSAIGVSRSGVRIHTVRHSAITSSAATDPTVHAAVFSVSASHRGIRLSTGFAAFSVAVFSDMFLFVFSSIID